MRITTAKLVVFVTLGYVCAALDPSCDWDRDKCKGEYRIYQFMRKEWGISVSSPNYTNARIY